MGHWVNVSECARMYGRSRKWVDNRLQKHNISTEQPADSTEKRFQLVDFISHCGEPENNGTPKSTGSHNGSEQSSTPQNDKKEQVSTPTPGDSSAIETALLRQENASLTKRITELEGFLALQQEREAWMQGLIDRQLPALPKPKAGSVLQSFIGWCQGVKSH